MNKNQGSNLWPCRPVDYEPSQWWCGDVSVTSICQSGNQAYFLDYTSGSILGFPPMTSSPSAATQSSCDLATITFYISASSSSKVSTAPSLSAQTQKRSTALPTDPPAPAQSQEHSASLPTAIGFGVGIPLGIAAIGFLGFLFWQAAGRQSKSKSRVLSQKNALEHSDQSASAVIDRPRTELPDAQLPSELEDTSKRGLPCM